jgi:hypothetical protein
MVSTTYKTSKAMKYPLSQSLKANVTIYDRKYTLESNQTDSTSSQTLHGLNLAL